MLSSFLTLNDTYVSDPGLYFNGAMSRPCAQRLPSTVRRRIVAYVTSVLHHGPQQKRLSAAQRCNDDVLGEVFSHLDRMELVIVSLVCRNWLPAASRELYRDISLSVLSWNGPILAQTLTTRPDLGELVRRVKLRRPEPMRWDPSHFDWLALLPEYNLYSITFEGGMLNAPETYPILEFPAIRTTSRLRADDMNSHARTNAILNMTHLETLSIRIDLQNVFTLKAGVTLPRLRRLRIVMDSYCSVVEQILKGLDSPLEEFELELTCIYGKGVDSLLNGLQRHASAMQYMSLIGNPFSMVPFMDDHIMSFTSLKTLKCPRNSYTSLLISGLPPTLTHLILGSGPGDRSPIHDIADALQQNRRRLIALARVTIAGRELLGQWGQPLVELCMREGITFDSVDTYDFDPFVL